MPLPAPTVDRSLLHTRTIVCEGFERSDGLWDIDGWLTDIKTYDVPNIDRDGIPAGEPVHGMGLRMTIGLDLVIHDMVAVSDFTPFRMCPNITPNFKRLIGVSLARGFRREVAAKLGGTEGCVHLVDLLGPMATTVYQTLDLPLYRAAQEAGERGESVKPHFLNACHVWQETTDLVKDQFPTAHKGN